jgi:hypothetical protein
MTHDESFKHFLIRNSLSSRIVDNRESSSLSLQTPGPLRLRNL